MFTSPLVEIEFGKTFGLRLSAVLLRGSVISMAPWLKGEMVK